MIYKTASIQFISELKRLVDNTSKIVLTTHFSPDDDAVSSILSLYLLLTTTYPQKKIDMVVTGYPADRFTSFLNYEKIKFLPDLSESINEYNLLIALDGGQYSRFSNQPEIIAASNFPKICIDHHQSPPDNFTLTLQKPLATSTSELVFDISQKFKKLDASLAELLLLGILGDTGTFNYIKPGQYKIFRTVEKILSLTHINIQEFKSRYSLISPEAFAVIRELIKTTHFEAVAGWPDFQISYIDREYINKNAISDSLCSEASDIFVGQYLRLIKGYSWGVVIRPHSDGSCRLSLRSLPGSVNVRDLVERMGIGGGHDRAAGAKIISLVDIVTPEKVSQIIIDWLKNNQPVIN